MFALRIGVTYGYGAREELAAAGARMTCDSPAEVAEALMRDKTAAGSSR